MAKIRGSSINDDLQGGSDNDIITGGDGDDTLRGGSGDDLMFGGAGDDTLHGEDGNDRMIGGVGGDNTLYGGGGNDTVGGSSGDDLLYGGAGNDTLMGDWMPYDSSGVRYPGYGDDTLYGGSGDDRLIGNEGSDTLHGGIGNDVLQGGTGDDTLRGGDGNDVLQGGAGDDVFVYESGNDVIDDFTVNEDVIDLAARAGITSFSDLSLHQHGANVVIAFTEEQGGGKLELANVRVSDLGAEDFLFAGGSDDEGPAFVADTGEDGPPDETTGRGKPDSEADQTGDETGVTARTENAPPDDGNTVTDGSSLNGVRVLGGAGDDTLNGSDGNDKLLGKRGDDILSGGEGDDHLKGGAGDDTLAGGAGADTFVYGIGDGDDVIEDFADGEDMIDLSAFSGIGGFGDLTVTGTGNDVRIDLSEYGGGTITLQNFTLNDLDATDFVFHQNEQQDGM